MIVLLPGFVEPTRIYELKQHKNGDLTLKLLETVSGATMQDLMDNHLPGNKVPTVLMDSGFPEQQALLQRNGYHVIAGRL